MIKTCLVRAGVKSFFIELRAPSFNAYYPNISVQILHTVLSTFPKVLTRRILLRSSLVGDHFLHSHDLNV